MPATYQEITTAQADELWQTGLLFYWQKFGLYWCKDDTSTKELQPAVWEASGHVERYAILVED